MEKAIDKTLESIKRIVQKSSSIFIGALRQSKVVVHCAFSLSTFALLGSAQAFGAGPMSLVTYEEVALFAGLIEYKTGLRDRAGVMPP